ncbi:HAD family acid phosphatase [Roseateles aquatilis]|nr:HAD family acid phosphatase [Roseateles aquatilis]
MYMPIQRARVALLTFAALAVSTASLAQPVESRENLNATLWYQKAVERSAVTLVVYRDATAKLVAARHATSQTASLEQARQGHFSRKPPAIVLDIDETVLDNSAYNAGLVADGESYTGPTWEAWIAARRAVAIPGVKAMIAKARALRYRVVFITNRACPAPATYGADGRHTHCPQKTATLDNLEAALGYRPDDADLMLRGERQDWDTSDKSARRLAVATTHRIAMLFGDDLNDFVLPAAYDPDQHGTRWGTTWFAIPNPMYGSWGDALSLQQRYDGLKPWRDPATAARRVRVSSWNMEWLASAAALDAASYWSTCAAKGWPNERLSNELPYCDVYKRDNITSAADFLAKRVEPLRRTLAAQAALGLDVLAVQEVQNEAALRAVLPAGFKVACFTTRADAQNIGFAVRDGAPFGVSCRELRSLSLEDATPPGSVRRGLELTLDVAGRKVVMLNVHLKASCPTGRMDAASNANCRTLQRQAEPLEAWVEQQAVAGMPFLIIGDWNRDLEAEVNGHYPARNDGSDPKGPIQPQNVNNLFPEINDGEPVSSRMRVVAIDRRASAGKACHEHLDQLVVSDLLLNQLDASSLTAGVPAAKLVLGESGASDHCRIDTVLRLR